MHVGLWSTALLLALVLMRAPREWRETAGFDAGLNVGRFASVQPFAITHYLGLAVVAGAACLDYGWPAISPVTMAAAIGLLAVLGALCVAGLQRGRRIGFTVLALAILLLPSTVVPTADPVVEHRMYPGARRGDRRHRAHVRPRAPWRRSAMAGSRDRCTVGRDGARRSGRDGAAFTHDRAQRRLPKRAKHLVRHGEPAPRPCSPPEQSGPGIASLRRHGRSLCPAGGGSTDRFQLRRGSTQPRLDAVQGWPASGCTTPPAARCPVGS